ncbi:hypothetical protein [Streptomyces griseosporeus]|uniref:hypothetical protein n=1 Tax=Streptomyces griseosporeus TaxID=1910 RepID=UPI00378B8F1C
MYAPTTALLRSFHEALGARVRERTALLAEQLISPDAGSRLDAVRMSGELMRTWRGDHTRLLLLVADQLTTADEEVAAEAAAVVESCHPSAARAREALATHIDAHHAAHGPQPGHAGPQAATVSTPLWSRAAGRSCEGASGSSRVQAGNARRKPTCGTRHSAATRSRAAALRNTSLSPRRAPTTACWPATSVTADSRLRTVRP